MAQSISQLLSIQSSQFATGILPPEAKLKTSRRCCVSSPTTLAQDTRGRLIPHVIAPLAGERFLEKNKNTHPAYPPNERRVGGAAPADNYATRL